MKEEFDERNGRHSEDQNELESKIGRKKQNRKQRFCKLESLQRQRKFRKKDRRGGERQILFECLKGN